MSSPRESGVRSIGRALDLLDLLRGAGPDGLRVTDLAERLGVDAATISRALATLVSRGYASRLSSRRYTLGPWSARLPERWVDRVLQRAGPTLGELTQSTGETVYLLELLGGLAVTVASMRPSQRPTIALAMSFPRDSRSDAERARLKRLLRSTAALIA